MRFHNNWHSFFNYGCGDLGNDGVHRVDYARRELTAGFERQEKKLPDWPKVVSTNEQVFLR